MKGTITGVMVMIMSWVKWHIRNNIGRGDLLNQDWTEILKYNDLVYVYL